MEEGGEVYKRMEREKKRRGWYGWF